jgi:hypothetical protein
MGEIEFSHEMSLLTIFFADPSYFNSQVNLNLTGMGYFGPENVPDMFQCSRKHITFTKDNLYDT